MRYLGVDLGDKRSGLAVGDDESGVVTPLRTVERPIEPSDELIDAIAQAADEHGADEVVLGLPVNMDGTEGQRAKIVHRFADRLAQRLGKTPRLQDERLTTAEADWSMAGSGLTHGEKKKRRDALAAAAVLRDYFASRE